MSLVSFGDEAVFIWDDFASGELKEKLCAYSERTDIEKISRLGGDHFTIIFSGMTVLYEAGGSGGRSTRGSRREGFNFLEENVMFSKSGVVNLLGAHIPLFLRCPES